MSKKMVFVFNPKSGKGLIRNKLADILDIFVKADYDVIARPTQRQGDAREFAARYANQVDLVVCSGGDGTLDEVVSGITDAGSSVPIGYIPSGSTNDFGSSISMPKNMVEAARMIANGRAFPCDIGSFNDETFVYIAAFGMFTDVAYKTNQKLKNTIGHLAYLLEAGKKIFEVPAYRMKITAGEVVIEDEFAYGMVTNAISVGGMKGITGKDIQMDDGLFEVTLIRAPKTPVEFSNAITSLLFGGSDEKMLIKFKANEVCFEAETEVAWTMDGEAGGDHKRAVIKNRNKRMNFVRFD